MLATDKTVILSDFSLSGIVLLTMTSSMGDFSIRSIAGPDNTGWVATTRTLLAPFSIIISDALVTVPAVSIISSTITTSRSFTGPITVNWPTTLAFSLDL